MSMYTKVIGALALLLTATLAFAGGCGNTTVGCLRAPEIDPASAVAGMTLLLGGIAVMRGRKKR